MAGGAAESEVARVHARLGNGRRGRSLAGRSGHRRLLDAQRVSAARGRPVRLRRVGAGLVVRDDRAVPGASSRTRSARLGRTPTGLHPFMRAFVAAAQVAGFPLLADLDSATEPVGVGTLAGERARRRPLEHGVRLPRSRPGESQPDGARRGARRPRAAERHPAVGVLLADGRRLEANTVVLSAGAYFTPTVLLRSGIGPETELRRHGISVAAALPVGERLLDHCGTGIAWEPTEELHARTAAHVRETGALFEPHAVVKAASATCPDGSWDIHLLPWTNAVAGSPDRFEASCGCFHMKPLSIGRVRLRSADPSALPRRRARLPDEERGPDRHRRGDSSSPEASPPRSHCAGSSPASFNRVSATSTEYVASTVRNYFHPAGTCAIGHVTDPFGRVLGMEGLVVADASLMPTIPRANTNLTTVAIAERIAETFR